MEDIRTSLSLSLSPALSTSLARLNEREYTSGGTRLAGLHSDQATRTCSSTLCLHVPSGTKVKHPSSAQD